MKKYAVLLASLLAFAAVTGCEKKPAAAPETPAVAPVESAPATAQPAEEAAKPEEAKEEAPK